MVDHEHLVERANEWIVERPGRVVLAFFVVTAVFGLGLGGVSTESGTSQFTEDSPAEKAFTKVNRKFNPAFAPDEGSTQLIQTGENVLSKRGLLRMLAAQHRLQERDGLRVSGTSSAASVVARTLDPGATTLEAQIRAVERATPGEIDAAVRQAADRPGFTSLLGADFNRREASASATIGSVTHDVPGGTSSSAGASADDPMADIQTEAKHVVGTVDADIRVFGSGIIAAEFGTIVFDSLIIVVPAALVLILTFLTFAYRDPFDLVLGLAALGMTMVWTFGFVGLVGIPFTQMLIAVPPLLLAVGIDFGIHTVNRYREERVEGRSVAASMNATGRQLLVAFFIVTGTTVFGFASNLTSDLGPIREFGLVAAIGIVFTFCIFGVFLPAAKVWLDRRRDRYGVPRFGTAPLGREGSVLGTVLPVGVAVAKRAPRAFLLAVLVVSLAAGYYGTGVDTSFDDEDFLPPEETPEYLDALPEPFAPGEYTVTRDLNFLSDNFESAQRDSVTIYVEGPLREDYALESIQHAGRNPPDSLSASGRTAESESVVTVIRDYAAEDEEFKQLVARNDADGDGVPDDNLEDIYDELLASPYGDRALRYVTDDYRATRVVYTTKSDVSQEAITADARTVASRYRFDATATGQTVVFQSIAATILRSAVGSLAVALVVTAAFLLFIYQLLEDDWTLGVVNLAPIAVTVTLIAGSMRFFGVPFNALTATVLAITIGLGIDYSAHFVHRFADEFARDGVELYDALDAAVRGTGGALTGSMLTTTTGIGVLVLAITPILGQFGLVTALSIVYSYLTSLVVTPSAIVVREGLR
jgi:predicted RND superfamily exporter protein